jgi:hypothetical protein
VVDGRDSVWVSDEETASSGSLPEIVFDEAPVELIAERDGVDVTSYRLPPRPSIRNPFRLLIWLVRAAFGIVSLVLMLAVIAAIPIVNFLALGYLLEVEARVARTGRLRDAFLLLDVAPRIGSIALGIWLWVLPLRLLASARDDQRVILESSGNLEIITPMVAALVATHLCLALARGGSFWAFFHPALVDGFPRRWLTGRLWLFRLPFRFFNPMTFLANVFWLRKQWLSADYMAYATAGVKDFLERLRLKHHFLLGLKGFVGAFVWLVIPSALLIAGRPNGGGQNLLIGIGGVMLMFVLSWVPFLQARFAVTGRWKTMFDLRTIRELYRYAPLAWLFAIAIVYVLSLPLYLPKVFLLPRDAMWVITMIFIVTIYPARVATGWALHRAAFRKEKPWFGFRWLSRSVLVLLIGLYTFLLFFTPLIAEHGRAAIFEHHSVLLPMPAGL